MLFRPGHGPINNYVSLSLFLSLLSHRRICSDDNIFPFEKENRLFCDSDLPPVHHDCHTVSGLLLAKQRVSSCTHCIRWVLNYVLIQPYDTFIPQAWSICERYNRIHLRRSIFNNSTNCCEQLPWSCNVQTESSVVVFFSLYVQNPYTPIVVHC